MADSLRSDSYIKCLEEFLDNSKNANFVIEEIDKQAKSTSSIQDKSNNNNLFFRKQYFKNGVISDYIYEVVNFASKSKFFKTFTSITHERRVLFKYKIITRGFVNKFRQDYPEEKISDEELLRLFRLDFKEQIKRYSKLIHYYKFVNKRKSKFDHLVDELKKVNEKFSNENVSPQLKQGYIIKISKLNQKHQKVFMDKKMNVLEEFQSEINEYISWLTSDLNFFRLSKTDFGFLSVFLESNGENNKNVITLDKFEPLIQSCLQGLEFYKKVMDDYGYKISKDKTCAATAINTNHTSNTLKLSATKKLSASKKSTTSTKEN